MRRLFWTLSASALLAAACSSGDDTSSVDDDADPVEQDDSSDDVEPADVDVATASRIFVSDDGNAMVVAPPGEDTEITVDVLAADDYPAFLEGAQLGPGTIVYDLGPEGATFDEPVRFFRRLEVANFGGELAAMDVPIILLVTADADGNPELLEGHSILRTPSEVWVGADVAHFTPQATVNVQVDAETNKLFGDLLRAVQNDDGSQAITAIPEATSIVPAPTDAEVDGAFAAAMEPVFAELLHGSAVPEDTAADRWLAHGGHTEAYAAVPSPGAPGVASGDYLFPVGVVDTHDTDTIDYDSPRDVDFFRPLTLQFPDDLGRSSVASPAAVMSVGADVTIENPLFDGPIDVAFDIGVLVVDPGEMDGFRDALTGVVLGLPERDAPPAPDVVAVDPTYRDAFPYWTFVAHPGGPSSEVTQTVTITTGDNGFGALLDEFGDALYGFTATEGPGGSPAQIVGLDPLIRENGTATATTDIFCYCRHLTGIVLSPGEDPPPAEELTVQFDDDGTYSMIFEGDEVLAPVTLFEDGDGNPIITDVGPDEGAAFQGDASFRFEIPAEIFADGFESGDVSAWSSSR